jgi:hypothetical protein
MKLGIPRETRVEAPDALYQAVTSLDWESEFSEIILQHHDDEKNAHKYYSFYPQRLLSAYGRCGSSQTMRSAMSVSELKGKYHEKLKNGYVLTSVRRVGELSSIVEDHIADAGGEEAFELPDSLDV